MGAGGRETRNSWGERKVGWVEGGLARVISRRESKMEGDLLGCAEAEASRGEGKRKIGERRKISGLKRRRARRVSVNLTQRRAAMDWAWAEWKRGEMEEGGG